MNFIVIAIRDGEIDWISRCKTLRGAERSAKYMRELTPRRKVETRILSVQDILSWDDSGVRELEAMFKLEAR